MDRRTDPTNHDRGETLLELLVAVTIMGIAVVAIIAGIGTSILVSDIHRKQATAGTVVRNYAEAVDRGIAAGPYTSCATTGAYASPPGFSPTSGFTASITAVQYWNDTTKTFSGTCTTDGGVQKLSLRVASGDGRASETLDLIVRKPCATDGSCS